MCVCVCFSCTLLAWYGLATSTCSSTQEDCVRLNLSSDVTTRMWCMTLRTLRYARNCFDTLFAQLVSMCIICALQADFCEQSWWYWDMWESLMHCEGHQVRIAPRLKKCRVLHIIAPNHWTKEYLRLKVHISTCRLHIASSLFHSRLKTYPFNKSFSP